MAPNGSLWQQSIQGMSGRSSNKLENSRIFNNLGCVDGKNILLNYNDATFPSDRITIFFYYITVETLSTPRKSSTCEEQYNLKVGSNINWLSKKRRGTSRYNYHCRWASVQGWSCYCNSSLRSIERKTQIIVHPASSRLQSWNNRGLFIPTNWLYIKFLVLLNIWQIIHRVLDLV